MDTTTPPTLPRIRTAAGDRAIRRRAVEAARGRGQQQQQQQQYQQQHQPSAEQIGVPTPPQEATSAPPRGASSSAREYSISSSAAATRASSSSPPSSPYDDTAYMSSGGGGGGGGGGDVGRGPSSASPLSATHRAWLLTSRLRQRVVYSSEFTPTPCNPTTEGYTPDASTARQFQASRTTDS